MVLRFRQDVAILGRESQPNRNVEPLFGDDLLRRRDRFEDLVLSHGIGSQMRPSLVLGRPPTSLRYMVEPEAPVKPVNHFPKWLEGKYRPRGLSQEGMQFLHKLAPDSAFKNGGIDLLQVDGNWQSIEQRMAYLQRKYVALDLLRKGLVVEQGGRFWPRDLEHEARKTINVVSQGRERILRASEVSQQDFDDMLVWIATFREASIDQVRATMAARQDVTHAAIERALKDRHVELNEVRFGRESMPIGTVHLTTDGMKYIKGMEGGRSFLDCGFGTRKVGTGIGEYHEQAVSDGIGYYCHEVQEAGGIVTEIALDSTLRREYLGDRFVPDFRIKYEIEGDPGRWDVEVIGLSSDYRRSSTSAKTKSTGMRSFNPTGKKAGSGSMDVRVRPT